MFETPVLPDPLRIGFVCKDVSEVLEATRLGLTLDRSQFRIHLLDGRAEQDSGDWLVPDGPDPVALLPGGDKAAYLARHLPRHDLIVASPEAAHIAAALDRLAIAPPLIPFEALGSTDGTAPAHALAAFWSDRFRSAVRQMQPAPAPSVFASFWQGGFECSTHHRGRDGQRLDLTASTGHEAHVAADYLQAQSFGMKTVRDGVRWHLVEPVPGWYDFSSLTPMMRAAEETGTQVIWDLMHFGWPDGLDIWSPSFVDRFARFAAAVARHRRELSDSIPFWCPVNEISFLSWAAGDAAAFEPFGKGRGFELKVQLARAAIAAMIELRAVDPRARFVHCDPVIAVHPNPADETSRGLAETINEAQFEAFDLISGRIWPQLGGEPDFLDIIGMNYYCHNQWYHGGGRIDIDDPAYRPVSDLLFDLHARYGRPIAVTETGIEGPRRPAWAAYIAAEVQKARCRGVPVEGICLYPIANHLGWEDDRLCPNGLFGHEPGPNGRSVYMPLAKTLRYLQRHVPGEC